MSSGAPAPSIAAAVPQPIASKLLPGERVIWWGAPQQGLLLLPRDGLLIPFSLLWGGFAVFWESSVLNSKAPFPFALFGIPFVLIGLFVIAGRFAIDAWLRAMTSYALTDRRVLIVRTGTWSSVQSLFLDRLPEMSLVGESGGRGTIRFGAASPVFATGYGYGRAGFGSWVHSLDPTPHFLGIEDAPAVFAELQQRAHRAGVRGGSPGGE